jgi:DNA-binding beta-propeller fold protein YncE
MKYNRTIYRMALIGFILLIVLAVMLYFDQARAEAKRIAKPENPSYDVGEVAYVPMHDTNGLALIDIQAHVTIDTIDLAQYGCVYPTRARINPAGTEIYVMCVDSSNIVVLDISDLSLVATINRPGTCHQDIAFMQSGSYALASTSDCPEIFPIDVIDTTTHTIVQTIDTSNNGLISIAEHPYLPLAYASGGSNDNGVILVIDTNTFTVQTIINYGVYVWDVVPSPDGT